jgi:hypothetical protein
MTLLGKIMLYLNLVLGLVFACWGIGLYTGHVNWTDQKKGEQLGEFAARAERITALAKTRDLGEERWAAATTSLTALEDLRPKHQQWYAQELDKLRNGQGKVQDLVYANGALQINPATGLPQQQLSNFTSLKDEQASYLRKQEDIRTILDNRKKLADEEKQLGAELGDPRTSGLRHELALEQEKAQKARIEQDWLKPLLYNRMAEALSLSSRQKTLQARLKELENVAVTRQP